MLNSLFLN